MISPSRLVCRRGQIVPVPAKAWFEAGFAGNVQGGRGESMIAHLQMQGYVQIPHDRPAVAFGTRTLGPESTYLSRYEGIGPDGKHCIRWCDAWERPRGLGSLTLWDRDDEGRDAWLAECLALVSPGGLAPVQVQIAVQPLIRTAHVLMDRLHTPRGKRLLLAQLAHIPDEHLPDDLRAIRDAVGKEARASA
jgi:hypothetical protein